MNDQELVKNCLLQICGKLGLGSAAMTQRDHEQLSDEIRDKTGILISVSTIKRLLNGEFSRLPQAATLNAISGYLGYKNWYEYKLKENGATYLTNTNEATIDRPAFKNPLNKHKWKLAIGVSLLAAIIILAGFLRHSSKPAPNFDKAVFSVKKTTVNEIPNTVVFSYNIDEVGGDSFFIQQSWDEKRRVRIYKKTYTLTDIYYEPGYHTAKLIVNDKIIKTFDVSIPTNSWFFYSKEELEKGSPAYIKTSTAIKDGSLSITESDLVANKIDFQQERAYIYTYFPDLFNVSSDNFTMKTRVRAKQVRNNSCPWLMFEIFCQRNFMYFKSTSAGCANEAMLQFGEKALHGKTSDLSFLSTDINEWMDVETTVRNKQALIFINGKQVYSGAYSTSAGNITGLGFISNGLCEIDEVSLKGHDAVEVYSSTFD